MTPATRFRFASARSPSPMGRNTPPPLALWLAVRFGKNMFGYGGYLWEFVVFIKEEVKTGQL